MANEEFHEAGEDVTDAEAFAFVENAGGPRRAVTGKEPVRKMIAILRRGNVWYHKNICFNKGVRVVIDEAMFEWMEEHAVDFVGADDREVTAKAKFEYRDYDGPGKVGEPLDAFEDIDDDKLRRKEAYREPYRPPASRVKPVRSSHSVEHEEAPVEVRPRVRQRIR